MKIIMLGDSITEGYNGNQETQYTLASTIAAQTGNDVLNAGIGGTQVNHGNNCFTEVVKNYDFSNYDMAVIMYGTNDFGVQGESLDTFKSGYQQGIDKIKGDNANVQIRLVTPIHDYAIGGGDMDWKNAVGVSQNMINDAVVQIAQNNGLHVYDWRNNPVVTSRNQLAADGIHPTNDTYQKMGAALANWIGDDNAGQTDSSSNSDILGKIHQYKYAYFGFDPEGEDKSNPWKATPVLCGSDDAINWTVIAHFPQLGNLRDGNIAVYKDWYYITGTTGLYRTKDFNDFEELDSSFIEQQTGFHDIWAPEFFVDLQGNWHIIWCANNGQRHVYVGDFDPESGTVTNAWQQVDEDGGIDPHIWTANGKYYLSIDAYWLYQSGSYMGPFELINTDMVHDVEDSTHWYEAGETLQIGDTIYFYMDRINGSVPGVADSGYMIVQTAKVDDLTSWSGPQRVNCSINMRHGSFITINQQKNPVPEKTVNSLTLKKLEDNPFGLKQNVAENTISTVVALNSIDKFCQKLLGTSDNQIEINVSVKNLGLDRALRNFTVNSLRNIQSAVNDTVTVFNANDFLDIKTAEPVEYLSLNVPLKLMIDKDYLNTLNDDWKKIEDKVNELFAIIKQFTKGD